jgi:D-alanyl-lipoteichoic acid acyltransferase DltB (MBOAT superfamily)
MLFNSFIFFIFLGVVLPVFYLLPRKFKTGFLLAASYFFYGYWDWRFTLLLATSTTVDFFVAQKMYKTESTRIRKQLLLVSMVVNLGILATFKYFGFFVESFEALTASFGLELDFLHLNLILPVGISFYTFQTMSYTIDIYRRRMVPTKKFLDYALFVSFFPQLVAGPIERAAHLLPQIEKLPKPTWKQIENGITLIITGLFFKVMIGDTTGRIVDRIFGEPELYKSPELLAAWVLFSIQIYADFAGYSHIARGVAKMLGIELMKNFEQPYLSANITEFWRRWHISLSSWLKDYLYIPLGGNRKGIRRTYINLMITMLLGGLWHGASWNFVIWGGLHGVYLAVHKLMLGQRQPALAYTYNGLNGLSVYVAKAAGTFALVTFTWLFFRAGDLQTTTFFLDKMIHWESSEYALIFLQITLSFVLMVLVVDFFSYYSKKHAFVLAVPNKGACYGIQTAALVVTLLFMFQSDPLPFVYFQF